MKLKAFTPTQVKADLQFVIMVAAVLGLPISEGVSIALLGCSALVAVGLNIAEAHVRVGTHLGYTIHSVLTEIKGLVPAINSLVAGLPGQIGAEVKKVLETVEKGPQPAQASGKLTKAEVTTADKSK